VGGPGEVLSSEWFEQMVSEGDIIVVYGRTDSLPERKRAVNGFDFVNFNPPIFIPN